MAEKKAKHPILIVSIILLSAILFLGMVMTILFITSGPSSNFFAFGQKIGVISIQGTITDSEPVVSQLVNFRKNKRIKAIILRINSPGGGIGPSQEIYREVRKTIKTKKVVASMGSLAASGGYYIAAATDRIVANPGTLTGSIGVIMEFVHIQDLMKKLGIGLEVMKSGEFKDTGSPHRNLSERDRVLVKELISEIRDQFFNAVAQGRNLSTVQVKKIAGDARILTGARAKELGLIDHLGNFRDAVDLTKELAGIEGDITLVYPKKDGAKLLDMLFQNTSQAFFKVITDNLGPRMEYRWDAFSYMRD